MTSNTTRTIYDWLWWIFVGLVAYLIWPQLTKFGEGLDSIFQAYSIVVVILLCVLGAMFLNYLREALASSVVAFMLKLSGGAPVNYEKGNIGRNVERTARRLEKRGDHLSAGETYETCENWMAAARAYEKGNSFSRSAQMYLKAGDESKAIELFERDENFPSAGDLARKQGLLDRANRNYRLAAERSLEQNLPLPAAALFEQANDYNRAGATYETAHRLDEALRCYEKVQNTDKVIELTSKLSSSDLTRRGPAFLDTVIRSAELLARSGHSKEAGSLLENCGELTRAAEILDESGDHAGAGELYLKTEQYDRAVKCYSKVEDETQVADFSARVALQKGNVKEAGEFFEKAGKINQAIEAYKRARQFDSAAKLYEVQERYIMAGEMYSSARNISAAAAAYLKAYDWRNAAECFEAIGDFGQASDAWTNAGNYLRAGILAFQSGDYARAIDQLQKVPTASSDYSLATGYLAGAFQEQGRLDMAVKLYEKIPRELPLNQVSLPVYLNYAHFLERVNPLGAIAIYRQILGVNMAYGDAADRLKELEDMASKGNFANLSYSGKTGQSPSGAMHSLDLEEASSMTAARGRQTGSKNTPLSSITRADQQSSSHSSVVERLFGENDRYRIHEQLHRDGNCVMYSATDTDLMREVILRTSPVPSDSTVISGYMRTVRAIGRVSHPNLAIIFDTGEFNDSAFMASEVLEGESLLQQIRTRGPVNIPDLKTLMRQALTCLAHCHSQEIVHANLKPANIIVNKSSQLKITNIGFPSVPQPEKQTWSTGGSSGRNPTYLSPEQIIGSDFDSRADIYTMGLVMFYILTGRTPFEVRRVSDVREIARIQVQSALPRPSTIRGTLPDRIDDIFMKCTSKSPAARYQTAHDVLNELESIDSTFSG